MTREDERDMACTNWICSQKNGTVIKAREVWEAAVKWADQHPTPNWISVEEELPKADGRYIIADKYGGVEQMNFDAESKCWWLRGKGVMSDFVTHWMPMPQLPRKEE